MQRSDRRQRLRAEYLMASRLPQTCRHTRLHHCPLTWGLRIGSAVLLLALLMLLNTDPTASLHLHLQALSWSSDLYGDAGRNRHLQDESFVAYVADVNIGTPPQSKRLIVDTGSSALAMTPYTGSQTLNVTSMRDSIQYDKGSWEGVLSEDVMQLGRARAHVRFATITASADLFHDVGAHDGIWGLLYNPRRAKQYPLIAYDEDDNGRATSANHSSAFARPRSGGAAAHKSTAATAAAAAAAAAAGIERSRVTRGTRARPSTRREEVVTSKTTRTRRRRGDALSDKVDHNEQPVQLGRKHRRQNGADTKRPSPPSTTTPSRTPNFAIALCGGEGDLWLDARRTHIARRDWARAGAEMFYVRLVDEGIYLASRFTGISVVSPISPVEVAHAAHQGRGDDHGDHQGHGNPAGGHTTRRAMPKHRPHTHQHRQRSQFGNVEVDELWVSAGSGVNDGSRMSAIFDTGTTFLLLPDKFLQRVIAALKHHFRLHGMSIPRGVWDGYCATLDPTQWPPLVLHLKSHAITVSGHQYLNQQGEGVFCLGLGVSSSPRRVILGATVLQGLLLHFDVEHKRVGIAHQTPVVAGAAQLGIRASGSATHALAGASSHQRSSSRQQRRTRAAGHKTMTERSSRNKGRGAKTSSNKSNSRHQQMGHMMEVPSGEGSGAELAHTPGPWSESEAVNRFGAKLLNRPASEMLQRVRAHALSAGRLSGDWRTCMPTPKAWQAQLPPATMVDHLCNLLVAGSRYHAGTARIYRAVCAASCSDCSSASRSWCTSPTVEVWVSGHRSVVHMGGPARQTRGLCWRLSPLGALGIGQADAVPLVFLPGHGWASLRLECPAKAMYHAQCLVPATVSGPLCMVAAWLGTFALLLAVYELLCVCHRLSLRWQGPADDNEEEGEEEEERKRAWPQAHKDQQHKQGSTRHTQGPRACLREDLERSPCQAAQRQGEEGLHQPNGCAEFGLGCTHASSCCANPDLASAPTEGVHVPGEQEHQRQRLQPDHQHHPKDQHEEPMDTVADAVVVLGLG